MVENPTLSKTNLRMADWSNLKSEFVWAYEGVVGAPYRNTRNHHQGQSALLLRSGHLTIENENGVVRVDEGMWAFPREGSRLQRFSDNARVVSVHFQVYWPGNQPLFDFQTALVFKSSDYPELEKQSRRLCRQVDRVFPGIGAQLPWTRGSLSNYLELQIVFTRWLNIYVNSLLAAGVTPSRLGQVDERVLRAAQILDDLPVDVSFDERWLAKEVGLSASQLDRIFGKQFDLTPRQYFENRKLARAKDLIRSAPLTIKQIAYETGFRSLPYFSRWFHAKTGQSPRAFKKAVFDTEVAPPVAR